MTTYNLASQKFVIRYNRNGQAYLKQKINMFRATIISTFLIMALSIGSGFAYINYEQEQKIAVQLKNEKEALELQALAEKETKEAIALAEKKRLEEMLAAKKLAKEKSIHKAIVSYISTHYRISEIGAAKIVAAVIEAGNKSQLDFSLITAIIAIESGFNPYAKSVANAQGLMQVIPRWHPEKMKAIGGSQNIIETRENILAGSATFKDYLKEAKNNKVLALQRYNGDPAPSGKYSNSVLKEQVRIDQWLSKHVKV